MEKMQIGAYLALAVVAPTGVHSTTVYLFILNNDRLINVAVLDS